MEDYELFYGKEKLKVGIQRCGADQRVDIGTYLEGVIEHETTMKTKKNLIQYLG